MKKETLFSKVKFIKTALLPKDYPICKDESGRELVEVAVAGRSNVGKSSLLNHLFHVKGLVKTGGRPGKTQALQFFNVGDQVIFVDLPGYGFAHVPKAVKKEWGPMIQTYLEKREALKLILWLLDIRRIPSEEDLQFLTWASFHKKPVILVLTKVDKVSQSELTASTKAILHTLKIKNASYVHYSVLLNRGRDILQRLIVELIHG